jgi:mannose-6-phosphate isomerase-like protein (cupin superfamily)
VDAVSGIIVVPPGEGEVVPRRSGERTVVKAAEAETRGAYAVRENTAPAGSGGVPFHRHLGAEEAFYILEGELTVFTEDRTLAAPAGTFVLVPRGTVHSLANRAAVPVRWLTLISPAWVSGWIQEEAAALDERQRAAVYLRYGLEIVGPPPAP